jgi:hypothetical protein
MRINSRKNCCIVGILPNILLSEKIMKESYSEKDTDELMELATSMWETDYESKKIKRKSNVLSKKIPVIALYRMVRQERRINESKRGFDKPFVNSSFTGVLGLSEGWNISVEDRKYLEKDLVLFASDKKTILILPENRAWWESTWFNAISFLVGIVGLLVGLISGT